MIPTVRGGGGRQPHLPGQPRRCLITVVPRGKAGLGGGSGNPPADRPERSTSCPGSRGGTESDDHLGSGRQREDVAAARVGRPSGAAAPVPVQCMMTAGQSETRGSERERMGAPSGPPRSLGRQRAAAHRPSTGPEIPGIKSAYVLSAAHEPLVLRHPGRANHQVPVRTCHLVSGKAESVRKDRTARLRRST